MGPARSWSCKFLPISALADDSRRYFFATGDRNRFCEGGGLYRRHVISTWQITK